MRIRVVEASGVRTMEIAKPTWIVTVVRRGGCFEGHSPEGARVASNLVSASRARERETLAPKRALTRLCAAWERPRAPPCLRCLQVLVAKRERAARRGITASRTGRLTEGALPLELLRWLAPWAPRAGDLPSIAALNAGGDATAVDTLLKSADGIGR